MESSGTGIRHKQKNVCNRSKYIGQQHPPQICIDSVLWDEKQNHADPDHACQQCDKQNLPGIAESVQNTVQQTGDIQQGTQPGELADKIAGQRIVKQNFAHPVTENQKQNRKNKAKKQSRTGLLFLSFAQSVRGCVHCGLPRQPEVKGRKRNWSVHWETE